jgi:GH24 family phage-related lysozyme (muramidase)
MASKLISDAAAALIIEQEVSSEAAYKAKYQRPERPGGASGITIGIGYDCGYSTPNQIRADWTGRISASMVEVLATRAAGITGDNAQARLAELRPQIVVPWEAAISEFNDVEVPRWVAKVKAYLPNTELLHPDSLGAIVSLTYNRGPSFNNSGDRYTEMRAIKAAMIAKRFADIPAQFRSMKRIWAGNPSMRGLLNRREQEAKLFERGLASPMSVQIRPPVNPPNPNLPPPSLWDRFTGIFGGR